MLSEIADFTGSVSFVSLTVTENAKIVTIVFNYYQCFVADFDEKVLFIWIYTSTRHESNWELTVYGAGENVVLESVGCSFPVDQIFENVVFD